MHDRLSELSAFIFANVDRIGGRAE